MPQPYPLQLHIIEPTLANNTGHCHSLVRSLAQAAPECDITVWANRHAGGLWRGPGRLQAFFHRHLRRPQALLLYRRLLRQPGRMLVATAGSTDLVLADWAAPGRIPPHKLFLFVHWLNAKASKARLLSTIAKRQPNMHILAPTASVAEFFRSCGFQATVVPYPLELDADPATASPAAFKHLLVAGGARMDKGFGHVVDLVIEMGRRGLNWPVVAQISAEDRHRRDPALAQHIERLRAAQYGGLTLHEEAMSPEAYHALFAGAIAIQPYRAQDFKDRVSGVTLDALRAGAPVVVTDGTWMAALVRRFDAGVATADLSATGLLVAVEQVLNNHAHYAAQARLAAAGVSAEHSARRLLDVVLQRPEP